MQVKRIIAGILAVTTVLTTTNFITVISSAETDTDFNLTINTVDKWEGYKDREVVFDTYEGEPDTSWYTRYAGTKEDPYIISSAEEFAGIAVKSATKSAYAEYPVSYPTALTDKIDYTKAGTKYFLSKSAAPSERANWYSGEVPLIIDAEVLSVDYECDSVPLIINGNDVDYYYVTKVTLTYNINGIINTIDITGYAEELCDNMDNLSPFNPPSFDSAYQQYTYYNDILLGGNTSADKDSKLGGILNKNAWSFVADNVTNIIQAYCGYPVAEGDRYDFSAPDFIYIGEVSDFVEQYPTLTVTNSTGETIEIQGIDYDKYYKSDTAPSLSTSGDYPITTTVYDIEKPLFAKVGGTEDTVFNASSYYTENSISKKDMMYIVNEPMRATTLALLSPANTYYWQKTDTTLSFDSDLGFYSINVPTQFFLFTCKSNVSFSADRKTLTITTDVTDSAGRQRQESMSWILPSTIPSSCTCFSTSSLTLRYAINVETGSLTVTPSLYLYSPGRYSYNVGDLTEKTVSDEFYKLRASITDYIDTLTTITGDTFSYAAIKDTLIFRGVSSSKPQEHEQSVRKYIYLNETLPTLLGNSATDPTFKGKYFKLAADIEWNRGYIFPLCKSDTIDSAGLAADFDLAGHVIRCSTPIVGNLTKFGRLHNGIIVNKGAPAVAINMGVIEDIAFMSDAAFTYTSVSYYGSNCISTNMGIIRDCDINILSSNYMSFVSFNSGDILNIDVLISELSGTSPSCVDALINTNFGVISGMRVIADTKELSSIPFYYLIRSFGGNLTKLYLDLSISDTAVNFANFSLCSSWITGCIFSDSILNFYLPDSYNGRYPFGALSSNVGYSELLDVSIRNITANASMPRCGIFLGGDKISGVRNNDVNIVDCVFNIDIRNSANYGNVNTAYIQGGNYINCEFNIDGHEVPEHGEIPRYSYGLFSGNFINCDIAVKKAWYSTSYRGFFYGARVKGCNVHIEELGAYKYKDSLIGTPLIGSDYITRLEDTVIEIDKAVNSTSHRWGDGSYDSNILTGLACTNRQPIHSNVDFIVHEVRGRMPRINGMWKDSRFYLNFVEECTMDKRVDYWHNDSFQGNMLVNCELYYMFDDNVSGGFAHILSGLNYGVIHDTFIYIDEMPDTLTVNNYSLLSSGSYKNVTVMAPKLNLATDMREFAFLSSKTINDADEQYGNSYGQLLYFPQDINIYANIHLPDNEGKLWAISGVELVPGNSYGGTLGINALINVYNADGNPANIPVFATSTNSNYTAYSAMRINNVVLKSNTLSAKSAIFTNRPDGTVSNNFNVLFWGCYMDLPNAQSAMSPSDAAEFRTPGFFGLTYPNQRRYNITDEVLRWDYANSLDANYSDNEVTITTIANLSEKLKYSRCYLPEGHSAIVNYFSSDPNVVDSWNVTDAYIDNYTDTWTDHTKHFDFDAVPEGVNFVGSNAYSSGELAYLLDRGDTGVRRTYRWTVLEKDTKVYNSITNEELCELPCMTWLSAARLPKCSLNAEINTQPVFKSVVETAEQGYIELKGLNDTSTADGAVYVKQGDYIINDVVPENDEVVLIYAKQKLGTAYPVKIPSMPIPSRYNLRRQPVTHEYDISGYKQQGIDTVITPVFKTARYVMIDITNSEHGTIVPSDYVSAEGEKITLEAVTDKGYVIDNLCINGVPLTEMEFYMPDEDVVITGDCVELEGGITAFALFGIDGVIDQKDHTITVDIPKSTYVTNALPYIEYIGDYIVPSTSTRVDFTNPVEYTVYYGENQSVTYLVTVNQSDYTMKIYDYVINGVHGTIDQANKRIDVLLPAETDLRSLTPDDIAYSAETITPAVDTTLDFTISQTYTLYATGMTPVSYVVNVSVQGEDTAVITSYKVSGVSGVIDEDNSTITLNMPKGIDLTNVVPDIITYAGKLITPSKIAPVNLDEGTTYSVTSQSDSVRTYNIRVNYISDDEAHIDRFVLAGYEGSIDQQNKTIMLEIPANINITGITPDVLEYTGKSIYDQITVPKDFTRDDITYTVVAPDNTEVTYSIKVLFSNAEAKITEFAILGFEGVIDQETKTITVDVPYGVDISDTPPSKVIYTEGATLEPTKNAHQNFTEPVQYTVTSGNHMVSNKYTVTVRVQYPDTMAKIVEFYIDEYKGEINEARGVIEVTLPHDYPKGELPNKVPKIIWLGEMLTPPDYAAQDFTKPVKYTVYAEDLTVTKNYTVYVTVKQRPQYTITYRNNEGGLLLGTHTVAYEGDMVSVIARPKKGYNLVSLLVDGVTTNIADYTFTMPGRDIVVEALFEQEYVPVETTRKPIEDTPKWHITTTEATVPTMIVPIVSKTTKNTTVAEIVDVPVPEETTVNTTLPPPVDEPIEEEDTTEDDNPPTGIIVFTPLLALLICLISGTIIVTRKREDD